MSDNYVTSSPTSANVNLNKSNLSLFPNPVSDFLNIEYPNKKINSLTIFNAAGEVIFEIKNPQFNKLKINTENFDTVIYFLRIDKSTISETKKFIKV